MIAEIAVVGTVGGVALALMDQQNVFGNNPLRQWFWERPPFKQVQTQNQRTYPQIARPPTLSPRQQLAQAEQALAGQQQMVNAVIRAHPELTSTKYVVTAQ